MYMHVYGTCIWYMYMVHVYGTCIWYMYMVHVYASTSSEQMKCYKMHHLVLTLAYLESKIWSVKESLRLDCVE